jgi:hypothetical protein
MGDATPTVVISTPAIPATDIESPTFYFYRWTQNHLEVAREATLVEHHGVFQYTHEHADRGTWIAGFLSPSAGHDKVRVEGTDGVRILHGFAEVRGAADGFHLIRYVEPLQP